LKSFFLILIIFYSFVSFAQDSTGSLAFKNKRPVKQNTIFYQPDLSYRIWQQFNLIKEANSGNPLAQHELGLRYLLGEDQPADTVKAVEWIRKAALQKLPAAAFNYGILLYNGWGADWNPYEAYNNFLIAAKDSMPQALYVLGILHTDNLIVRRDWKKAYHYTRMAADKGHKPASEILGTIMKYLPGVDDEPDYDTKRGTSASATGLVFIDFDRPASDPAAEVSDTLLFEDLLLSGNKKFEKIFTAGDNPEMNLSRDNLMLLEESAAWGCPEAITLLGRLHEKGIHYDRNLISAAAYYIRGARMDSYRSTFLLFRLVKEESFLPSLKEAAVNEDPEAMFVWYGLYNFNLENSILEKDAVNLLLKSSERNYLPAVIELGLNLYTGKYFNKDINSATELWERTAARGLNEARVRIAASVVYGETSGNINNALKVIYAGIDNGSLLAQVVIGYAYENSIISSDRKGEEIVYYRNAAQRGNRFSLAQLERRYNEIRPSDPKFKIQ
jgi:uncharacterized protein